MQTRVFRTVLTLTSTAALGFATLACAATSPEPVVARTVPGKPTTTPVPPTTVPKDCTPATITNPPVDQKPVVGKGEGDPPKELKIEDLVVGDGAEAKTGDTVKVQYVGVLFADGSEFDSSWSKGATPLETQVGAGMVIQGWDQGLPGMKVGGKRKLIIPAALAYGAESQGAKIPANSDLIFVVELQQVCTPRVAPPATTPGSITDGSAPAGSTPPGSASAGSTPAGTAPAGSTPPGSTP